MTTATATTMVPRPDRIAVAVFSMVPSRSAAAARLGLAAAGFLQRLQPLLDPVEGPLHLVVAVSGLRALAVDQERGQHHEREQLEELRLPVLQGAGPELPEEAADQQRLLVLDLLVGPGEPLGDELADPAEEEQPGQGDAQAVVLPDPLHLLSPPGRYGHGEGTRSSARIRARARRIRRDTCICEQPTLAAMASCFSSSKNRMMMIWRSRSGRAATMLARMRRSSGSSRGPGSARSSPRLRSGVPATGPAQEVPRLWR